MTTERKQWVDVLKGFGILLVVAGHVLTGTTVVVIYMFHMPLFFFISGVLFKPENDVREYAVKKSVHLLIPYLSFLFLLNSDKIVNAFFLFLTSPSVGLLFSCGKEIAKQLYGGVVLWGVTGVFWFVTCLFFTQQCFNYLILKCKKAETVLLVFLAYVLSLANAFFVPEARFPLALNTVFAALPFFAAGYFGKPYLENKRVMGFVIAVFFVAVFFVERAGSVKLNYNMKLANYGWPFVSFLIALGGIGFSVWLARAVSVVALFEKFFSSLGRASLVIMFLHQAIQLPMKDSGFPLLCLPAARIFFAVLISFLLYRVCEKTAWFRILFLGSYEDFRHLPGRRTGAL